MKWLDKKIQGYQQQAFETFEKMQDASPEELQAAQLNVLQAAQQHIDPASATALGNAETTDFLMQSREEQLRQQQQMQANGQRLHALWQSGVDVEITILALEATGVVLGGQREYSIDAQVDGASGSYRATVLQLVPAPVASSYSVGARFTGKADPQDPTAVGIFQPLA